MTPPRKEGPKEEGSTVDIRVPPGSDCLCDTLNHPRTGVSSHDRRHPGNPRFIQGDFFISNVENPRQSSPPNTVFAQSLDTENAATKHGPL